MKEEGEEGKEKEKEGEGGKGGGEEERRKKHYLKIQIWNLEKEHNLPGIPQLSP